MSFRRRIALLAGSAVAVAIVLASVLAYLTISRELHDGIDDSLRERATQVERASARLGGLLPLRSDLPSGMQRAGGVDFSMQFLRADGTALTVGTAAGLPVDTRTRAVAAGAGDAFLANVHVDGVPLRMLVAPLPNGGALQLARSLQESATVLNRIRLILLLVACAGIAVAALLGRFVAGRAIEPLRRLTRTAEHVAETHDLGQRIETRSGDEIGRLARSFNEMLDELQSSMQALDASMRAQRQLVADASHELRTPVTSLRTNLEVLQENPDLDPQRRATLLDRATAQTGELTALMNDLIDLARGDEAEAAAEPVRLDELVEEAIERAQRHAPAFRFAAELEETVVRGSPRRLARAVNNLLDNAVAWSPPAATIDVRLADGELTVRDRGPGFEAGELEQVFDRFFRGARARERPGSGLGLSIVRQVAETHGGSITAANHAQGGGTVSLRLHRAEEERLGR